MGRRKFPWLEGESLSLVVVMVTGSTHCRRTQAVPWQSIPVRTLTSRLSPPPRCCLPGGVCCHGDVDVFQELMSLGLDRLKSGLIALGLKCGG